MQVGDRTSRGGELRLCLFDRGSSLQAREQIEQHLYSWGQEVESNAIEVHVHHLRRKLGASLIQTVRGVGYVLVREKPGP